MSVKGKNLSYESKEPTFLRRLRGEIGGNEAPQQDRLTAISKRLQKSLEDDEPTYVLEETNETISKHEYEELAKRKSEEAQIESTVRPLVDGEPSKQITIAHPSTDRTVSPKPLQQVAEAGKKIKKRKAAKIIGEHEDEEGRELLQQPKSTVKNSKSKKKQIKLSFDED